MKRYAKFKNTALIDDMSKYDLEILLKAYHIDISAFDTKLIENEDNIIECAYDQAVSILSENGYKSPYEFMHLADETDNVINERIYLPDLAVLCYLEQIAENGYSTLANMFYDNIQLDQAKVPDALEISTKTLTNAYKLESTRVSMILGIRRTDSKIEGDQLLTYYPESDKLKYNFGKTTHFTIHPALKRVIASLISNSSDSFIPGIIKDKTDMELKSNAEKYPEMCEFVELSKIFNQKYQEDLQTLCFHKLYYSLIDKYRTNEYLQNPNFDKKVRQKISFYYNKLTNYEESNAVECTKIQGLIDTYIMDLLFAYDFYITISANMSEQQLKNAALLDLVYKTSETKPVIARKKHALMYVAMKNMPYIYKGKTYPANDNWSTRVKGNINYLSKNYYPALYYTFLYCLKKQATSYNLNSLLSEYLTYHVASEVSDIADITYEIETCLERRKTLKRFPYAKKKKADTEYNAITKWYKMRITKYLDVTNYNPCDYLFARNTDKKHEQVKTKQS